MGSSPSVTAVESADLVVASEHWPLVPAEPDGLAVDVQHGPALRLTKATLPDVRRAAALVEQQVLGSLFGYAPWSGTSFAAAVVSGRPAALAAAHDRSARDAVTLL